MARVLVIDDDADARDVLSNYLERNGHTVILAPDGHEAMAALTHDHPDVVILDYKMPKMDGINFLEVIRCYLSFQELPVILLTGYPEGQHIRKAVELGVRKTFLKGAYDLSELLAHVEACSQPVSPPPSDEPGYHAHRFSQT